MWRPESWSDLEGLLGQAEETSTLDFKRELTSSREIAKDIAAMTVNGGTILYGVTEDRATGVATSLNPFPLKGIEERIQQITGTRVSPSPAIEIQAVPNPHAVEDGIVAVVVHPSSWAPHQVDARYPVRRGTTTDYLEEPEVERLYRARHQQVSRSPRELLIPFNQPPGLGSRAFTADAGIGVIQVTVAPTTDAGHPATPWLRPVLERVVKRADERVAERLSPSNPPNLFEALGAGWRPWGTAGWQTGEEGFAEDVLLRRPRSAAVMAYPSHFSFWISLPLAIRNRGAEPVYYSAFEWLVAAEIIAALAIAGEFIAAIPTVGVVACSLELAGFRKAIPWWRTQGLPDVLLDAEPVPERFTQATYASLIEFRETPDEVARVLMSAWLATFYEGRDLISSLLQQP